MPSQPHVLVGLARKVCGGSVRPTTQAWLQARLPILSHSQGRRIGIATALFSRLVWTAPLGTRIHRSRDRVREAFLGACHIPGGHGH